MPRYRFRTADGQVFESERGPAAILKAHPGATITHRVVDDGFGQAVIVPYEGKATAEPEPVVDAEPAEEPEKSEPKRVSKKSA